MFSTDGSSIEEQVAGLLRGPAAGGGRVVHGRPAGGAAHGPAGSSEYFAGGVVAYSNEAKMELLGVPGD